MLKVAAIDVGSNVTRIIVCELDDLWKVKAIENIRIPVRLGQGVFTKGMLDEISMQQPVGAFLRFQRISTDLGVYRLRAAATSAMREARNGLLLRQKNRFTQIVFSILLAMAFFSFIVPTYAQAQGTDSLSP
jgi:exopolyphosphatase/guanosine-5'-triphosphate,3'-diphosphate pyrophosphatase